jgi:hypothetical protein
MVKINGAKTLPYQPPQPQTNKTRNTVSIRVARFRVEIKWFASAVKTNHSRKNRAENGIKPISDDLCFNQT